jgi:hypothetical protein
MALDYTQTADLMNDVAFRGRVKVACLKFADYIFGEPNDTPAHMTRAKWASNTYANPEQSAMQVTPGVVMDPAVQTDGAAITDVDLQAAVEGVVNRMM